MISPTAILIAVIVALVSLGADGFLAHHYGFKSGVATVSLQDAATLAAADKANAAKVAQLTTQLEAAQHEYDQINKQLDAYVAANPVGVVRLCGNPNHSGAVPGAAANPTSPTAAGGPAADVQPVPSRDSGVGSDGGADIGSLLSLLAQRADQLNAQLSSLQTAEQNR